jgi:hypothetical protein
MVGWPVGLDVGGLVSPKNVGREVMGYLVGNAFGFLVGKLVVGVLVG